MMDGFVRLTTPLEPGQAEPLLIALRSAGLDAVIAPDAVSNVIAFSRPGPARQPIYVPVSQREAAEVLLHELAMRARGRLAPEALLACPECGGATRLQTNRVPRLYLRVLGLIGLSPPRPRQVCLRCGHRWYPARSHHFTANELGYDPNAPLIDWRGLQAGLRKLLAWTRSLGNNDQHRP